jgi:hypothetical protein
MSALKKNISVHLIIQMHYSIVFSICTDMHELYKQQNPHKGHRHQSCIHKNGNFGHNKVITMLVCLFHM